jgi:hypothetical protein
LFALKPFLKAIFSSGITGEGREDRGKTKKKRNKEGFVNDMLFGHHPFLNSFFR